MSFIIKTYPKRISFLYMPTWPLSCSKKIATALLACFLTISHFIFHTTDRFLRITFHHFLNTGLPWLEPFKDSSLPTKWRLKFLTSASKLSTSNPWVCVDDDTVFLFFSLDKFYIQVKLHTKFNSRLARTWVLIRIILFFFWII